MSNPSSAFSIALTMLLLGRPERLPSWAGTAPADEQLRGEHEAVRLVDLAGPERLSRLHELRAGDENRRPADASRSAPRPRRPQRAHPPGPRRAPCPARAGGAGGHIAASRAHVRARRDRCGRSRRGRPVRACSSGTTASLPSGTTPPVEIAMASPDPSGRPTARRRRRCRRAQADRAAGRIGRAERESVHRRARKRRQVDGRARPARRARGRRRARAGRARRRARLARSRTSRCASSTEIGSVGRNLRGRASAAGRQPGRRRSGPYRGTASRRRYADMISASAPRPGPPRSPRETPARPRTRERATASRRAAALPQDRDGLGLARPPEQPPERDREQDSDEQGSGMLGDPEPRETMRDQ